MGVRFTSGIREMDYAHKPKEECINFPSPEHAQGGEMYKSMCLTLALSVRHPDY